MGIEESSYSFLGDINKENLSLFLRNLQSKISDSCTKLHFYINSNGGNVSVALAWASLLRSLPCEVITYNMANVDSAAIILFAAGKKRVCAKHALFVLHEVAKEIKGLKTSKELRILADEIDQDTTRMTEFLQLCTNVNASVWMNKMDTMTTLLPQDAVELGLATNVEEMPLVPSA